MPAGKKKPRKKKEAHITAGEELEPLRIAVGERPVHLQWEGEPEVRWHDKGVEEVKVGGKGRRPPVNVAEFRKLLWQRRTLVKPPIAPGPKSLDMVKKQLASLRTQIMRRQMELKEGRHMKFGAKEHGTLYKILTTPLKWTFGWLVSPEPLTGTLVVRGAKFAKGKEGQNQRDFRKFDLSLRITQLEILETRLKLNGDIAPERHDKIYSYKKFVEDFNHGYAGKTMADWEKADMLLEVYRAGAQQVNAKIAGLKARAKQLEDQRRTLAKEYTGFVNR